MKEALKRVLTARPEVQAAMIATLAVLSVFDVLEVTGDQKDALNLAIIAWFGLASRLAFQKDLEDLRPQEA